MQRTMDEGKASGRETTKKAGRETTYFKILIKSSSTSIDMDDNGAARTVLGKGFVAVFIFSGIFFVFDAGFVESSERVELEQQERVGLSVRTFKIIPQKICTTKTRCDVKHTTGSSRLPILIT